MIRLFFLSLLGIALLAGIVLGTVSWPVTDPLNSLFHSMEVRWGWRLAVSQASWTPWRDLEVKDLKLESPQGGRFHVVDLKVLPHFGSLLKGSLATEWRLGEIRVDPGSWGIRQPALEEILSAGPVTTSGFALLQLGLDRMTLKTFYLKGPLGRVEGQGSLTRGEDVDLVMSGALAREPFSLKLRGALGRPQVSFTSNFLSISMNSYGDKR
ncbi:MAG: hypothetical protein HYZ93_04140 [Candidatus Omnitrophica bacterium]|nr:hypothetical protein [Candidatus Omnitrophota bacterium]